MCGAPQQSTSPGRLWGRISIFCSFFKQIGPFQALGTPKRVAKCRHKPLRSQDLASAGSMSGYFEPARSRGDLMRCRSRPLPTRPPVPRLPTRITRSLSSTDRWSRPQTDEHFALLDGKWLRDAGIIRQPVDSWSQYGNNIVCSHEGSEREVTMSTEKLHHESHWARRAKRLL